MDVYISEIKKGISFKKPIKVIVEQENNQYTASIKKYGIEVQYDNFQEVIKKVKKQLLHLHEEINELINIPMKRTIEDDIKDEISYCQKKFREYKKDKEENTGGASEYWRGKSETHNYIANRLKKVLKWNGVETYFNK